MRTVAAVIALALAGCATPTPEERAHAMIAEQGATCTALGYTPSTDAWRDCVQRQYQARTESIPRR